MTTTYCSVLCSCILLRLHYSPRCCSLCLHSNFWDCESFLLKEIFDGMSLCCRHRPVRALSSPRTLLRSSSPPSQRGSGAPSSASRSEWDKIVESVIVIYGFAGSTSQAKLNNYVPVNHQAVPLWKVGKTICQQFQLKITQAKNLH